ncbi:MAG: nucleotidyltransferase domain-containing protein, partial [Chitinophagales bacterium]
EQEKNIRILYACETGSRAWGFASEDSDFDVRFIYVHNIDWYLSLDEKPDTISIMLEDRELDLVGWELRKTLRLMKKSNASVFEKLDSPEVYIKDDDFLKVINSYKDEVFSPIAVMYHYLSMCKNVFSKVENEEKYSLKMLFYSLRTALASKWVLDKKSIPPIVFNTLVKELDFDLKLKERITLLLELKSSVDEKYLHDDEEELIAFIRETVDLCNLKAKDLSAAKNKNVNLDFILKSAIFDSEYKE